MSRIDLPELGLGTTTLGNLYRAIPDDQAREVVRASWDAGIRYFDTAPHYGLGLAERRLGEALRTHPRDEYVVSTKIGRVLEPVDAEGLRDDDLFDVPRDHVRRWDFSADGVRRSLDDSLARLGLDRVDVLLIHDPDEHLDQAVHEAVPALARLRDEGVVGAIGVGSGTPRSLAALIGTGALDVAMVAGRYTLLDQSALHEVIPAAEEHGTRIIAVSVFNSGITASDDPADGATYEYGPASEEVLARARRIAEICAGYGVELPQAAIRFPLRHPAVGTVAIGMASPEEVRADAAHAGRPVPEELWAELTAEGMIPEGPLA
ncbi:aldo/keto reductase [Clavibacter lycopersici]|uniref:Aldo/keto reductase n=1 Tax=Clavibacter lycopersici TaxID=2301718 RepID=A0A399TFV9_9MICO|nr:aldo/keto reductase [Clavibacter lycopersici]RIJ52953.1 aldo/keto reductase [Clavibacter lycopersici]RIJ62124.1 aldo/keto reductase [Clavibacter lycopersici]